MSYVSIVTCLLLELFKVVIVVIIFVTSCFVLFQNFRWGLLLLLFLFCFDDWCWTVDFFFIFNYKCIYLHILVILLFTFFLSWKILSNLSWLDLIELHFDLYRFLFNCSFDFWRCADIWSFLFVTHPVDNNRCYKIRAFLLITVWIFNKKNVLLVFFYFKTCPWQKVKSTGFVCLFSNISIHCFIFAISFDLKVFSSCFSLFAFFIITLPFSKSLLILRVTNYCLM